MQPAELPAWNSMTFRCERKAGWRGATRRVDLMESLRLRLRAAQRAACRAGRTRLHSARLVSLVIIRLLGGEGGPRGSPGKVAQCAVRYSARVDRKARDHTNSPHGPAIHIPWAVLQRFTVPSKGYTRVVCM